MENLAPQMSAESQKVAEIIEQLKARKLSVFHVPESYTNKPEILAYERQQKMRISGNRGYDVIANQFFVEEELLEYGKKSAVRRKTHKAVFETFDAYWEYLQGDIYENACYRFAQFSQKTVAKYNLNVERLMERPALISDTIKKFKATASAEERRKYRKVKSMRQSLPQIVAEVKACQSAEEIWAVERKYCKDPFMRLETEPRFLLANYVQANKDKDYCLDTVFSYLAKFDVPSWMKSFVMGLCLFMDPDEVLAKYRYSDSVHKKTEAKNKHELKQFIEKYKAGEIHVKTHGKFDEKSHCFCQVFGCYAYEEAVCPVAEVFLYFETFDEFAKCRKGNLTYCDLSNALELDADFSGLVTDETTRLPLHMLSDLTYHTQKKYADGKFKVVQKWTTATHRVVKKQDHEFTYFFDFVAFLKGDLTNADLLFCEGLENLPEWDGIDFTDAILTSRLYDKFQVPFRPYEYQTELLALFSEPENNEKTTAMVLSLNRGSAEEIANGYEIADNSNYSQSFYYISDLHLMHRIRNAECRSVTDVAYTVGKIARTINEEAHGPVLIPGDIASDFDVFQRFIKRLDKKRMFVFTLGNHELWDNPDKSLEEIVDKYREVLAKEKMFLLQNALLYTEPGGLFDEGKPKVIEYDELLILSDDEIRERLRNTRYVILGGIGFSGQNTEFNATNGIYRQIMDRQGEIAESTKFETLYQRLLPILSKKHTIILTHMPKSDWSGDPTLQENLVYVSGHNHRNAFHDDGTIRFYADNQIGYHSENPHLKSFLIENDYDCFDDYADGIFTITPDQYRNFYRGKNIRIDYTQKPQTIYLLKRETYYCFLQRENNGSLYFLYGGQKKRAIQGEPENYYDHMPEMVAAIQKPMSKYSELQHRIAGIVKRIGGNGRIHGCIIDIDFENHIYLNPNDFTITGYWAADMLQKIVFPSVENLLQENCPALFVEYQKQIAGSGDNLSSRLSASSEAAMRPELYLDTDIYQASRIISKMQRLQSNILGFWDERMIHPKKQLDIL